MPNSNPNSELLEAARRFNQMSPDDARLAELEARAILAKELPFGVEGFSHFYWCGTQHELPPYALNVWVPALVEAKLNSTGVLLEGFRGATKSTIIFWWVLYVLGKRPVGNTVLVRINDAAAAETGNAMAEIIEKSMAWKLCFPNVVPDKDRRWSTEGWFVKDVTVKYDEWIQKTIADHIGEPSLLTAGITSGIHIGKHPSNGWYADDFHDEQNTRSRREMQGIVDTIEKNIIPTWNRPEGHPTLAVACTLWADNDGYHSLLKTGLFKHIKTPIYTLDPTSDIIWPGISNHDMHIRLTWPEAFPVEKILEIERENPVWFPVMYLCDLNSLKGTVLKKEWLHEYPSDKIGENWPVYFGIDFASSDDKLHEGRRDYFALAIGKAIPGGGVVLVDGLRGKFPSSDSMGHLQAFRVRYPSLSTIGLEKWGKGETFKDMLLYNTDLPVVPCPFEGTPVKSKGQRFQAEGGLAPMFVDGRMWIASEFVESDFGSAFEDEWVGWDGSASKTGNDDCLDAVYWLAYIAQGHLIPTSARNSDKKNRKKKPNPMDALTNAY
jgi:hypothetical protein